MSDMAALYRAHGVPYDLSLAEHPADWSEYLSNTQKVTEAGIRVVPPADQQRHFNQLLRNPLKHNHIIGIGGKTDDRLARLCAFSLFRQAWKASPNNPYWHVINGSLRDNIRDDENFRENEVGNPSLLVLAGVAANSTSLKFDKLRDILEMYTHIPRVLVLAGDDPLSFGTKYIFCNMQKVLCFD